MIIEKHLRELREAKGLLLRQVAAFLEVDTAYISKMERGEKSIKREYLLKLAELYKTDAAELLTIWLADKVLNTINEEQYKEQALKLALKNIK